MASEASMNTNAAAKLPRHYQEEVLELAQRENVIAALDTGTGKTFIGLLLLKSVIAIHPNSKTIFLVPKVPLVEQQGSFISSNSTLRVLKLHGALNIDLADRRGWNDRFNFHDVFVMTAQIFLDLITHSIWSVDKVTLMIFDECHHTRKNHPYNCIMREYFQLPRSKRPKVFGMTASPVWDVKDAIGSLAALEANMDSKVVAVRKHADELAAHVQNATETVEKYPSPPTEYDFPSPTLWMCLTFFKTTLHHLNIAWEDIERRYTATLSSLGPYCASMYLHLEMRHRLSQCERLEEASDASLLPPPLDSTLRLSEEIAEILDILEAYDQSLAALPVCPEWCSPKIAVLVDILLSHKSPTFQGIVFVEQRHVAVCLARVLPCIPALCGAVRCAELISRNGDTVWGASNSIQSTLQSFREGEINLIVATAVAEEGLDFPACDLVVRFDALQHMVGYVQSRGRARCKTSNFVIMVEENNEAQLSKYKTFLEKEPELKATYQTREEDNSVMGLSDDQGDEDIHPSDLLQRERHVVASTGAVLTFDSAINLLSQLCALIPHDTFTPPHTPKYSGDFQATVQLPSCLPLPQQDLRFQGPRKCSKREAKRAVAFIAVKRLHELEVFDQYLLPVSGTPKGHEDNESIPLLDVDGIPEMMQVCVKDPWTIDCFHQLWIHSIFIENRRVAGFITGTNLFPVEIDIGSQIRTTGGELVKFDEDLELGQRELMRRFTKEGIWLRITASPVDLPLNFYLVPIADTGQPNFLVIRRLLASPRGESDWNGIDESDYGRLMVANLNLPGQLYLLQKIRNDLSPASIPPDGSAEAQAGFTNYHDYWTQKWTGKPGSRKRPPYIPESGSLLELVPFSRSPRSGVCPSGRTSSHSARPSHVLFPQGCCRWINISEDMYETFSIFPALHRRITDVYRLHRARLSLSLPAISEHTLIEALTLPCSNAGYSNQRLETLGDAVLQLCTTVHLFNRYPYRHEGQLSTMRQNSVSNRTLLSRAKVIGLETFLICETQDIKTWKSRIQCPLSDDITGPRMGVSREFPRRSLQDCMEASLGASFVTGGIEMSLHTGRALGLNFGGPAPWSVRYPLRKLSPVSSMFSVLEESLGYSFRDGTLLLEALTHPSFDNQNTSSYERLEFLGDAVLDLVVIDHMYRKYPCATSDQLAWPRTRAICAPALAFIAVKYLGLHQLMLVNNTELSMEIARYVPLLQMCSGEEMVERGWQYDPPKVLSDVFESVVGAVLVDSNYDYDRCASVVEYIMQDILTVLSPSVSRDPITRLFEWAAGAGCISSKHIVFRKSKGPKCTGVTALVHGVVVAGPIFSSSVLVAKNLAAESTMAVLIDPMNAKRLSCLCDCRKPPGT
ncbi:hypothetical protein B0H15DRAFT_838200 [Mycena belliarum]|uniref:Dicer-like protein 1 n=1 Tax=Mycena belliarum TaxID=1033014 RepID=A0AAD6U747_9AGAR|nr:hypothetical protein B0H15DRAFT_838200 [Mycena belliae]